LKGQFQYDTIEDCLAHGRVPAGEIWDIVIRHTEQADKALDGNGEYSDGILTTELVLMCERSPLLDYSTVARNLARYKTDTGSYTLDFNTADALLVSMGRFDEWIYDETLAYFYANVDLSWYECECPGCSVMIQAPPEQPALCVMDGCDSEPKARGLCNAHYIAAKKDGVLDQFPNYFAGPRTRYCSTQCRQSAYHQRKGTTSSRRKGYLKTRDQKCRNGHLRTPENTYVRPTGVNAGKRECLLCKRDSNNRSHAKRSPTRKLRAEVAA